MWWIVVATAATLPVAVDRPEGAACEAGDGGACTRVGVWYANGAEGMPRDPFIAGRFFHLGCDAGSADGCMFLAEAYRLGEGVLHDPLRPPELYTRACELGAGLGCRSVGDLVILDAVPSALPESAGEWYTRGCELGDGPSCAAAGLWFERNKVTDRSLPLFERGCELGHARACTLIAIRTSKGSDGAQRDAVVALGWYRKGCELVPFDPESCRELGWAEYGAIERKTAAPEAYGPAYEHLDEACYRNDTKACRYLARVAEATDRTAEALMAAERACDLGDAPACTIADRLRTQLSRDL